MWYIDFNYILSGPTSSVILARLVQRTVPVKTHRPTPGGVLSPFDGGGVRPEKKYRGKGVIIIPKKGGVRELE